MLTIAAVAFWSLGDGVLASATVARAAAFGTDYRLAALVDRMVEFGVRPDGHDVVGPHRER